ncbi:MAG TPA: hypothetical protein PL105_07395, partial [Caldilineaceae bacterium]|nr:hypothetical protein [Caldilineaceae bacterium]
FPRSQRSAWERLWTARRLVYAERSSPPTLLRQAQDTALPAGTTAARGLLVGLGEGSRSMGIGVRLGVGEGAAQRADLPFTL